MHLHDATDSGHMGAAVSLPSKEYLVVEARLAGHR